MRGRQHGKHGMRGACLAVLLLRLLCSPVATSAHDIVVGQLAPDFHARTFDGRDVNLADFKGHVLIINLWATWCEPCRKELPLLDTYYRLRKVVGLDVIAMATEDSVPASKLKPLATVVSFPFVHRMGGPYAPMGGVPTNFVIDRNGIVRYARARAFTLDDLNALLVPLLQEQAAMAPTPR